MFVVGARVFIHNSNDGLPSVVGTITRDDPVRNGCLVQPDGETASFGWGYNELTWLPNVNDTFRSTDAVVRVASVVIAGRQVYIQFRDLRNGVFSQLPAQEFHGIFTPEEAPSESAAPASTWWERLLAV